jgi:hypothetical protein
MRDRLIELCREAQAKYLEEEPPVGDFGAYLADRLLANGVIVPPCKVGDTLWIRWGIHESTKKIYPVKVYALRYDTKKNNMRLCVEANFEITDYGGLFHHHYIGTFPWSSVGKTVFLTKEEAEQALKGDPNG